MFLLVVVFFKARFFDLLDDANNASISCLQCAIDLKSVYFAFSFRFLKF